MNRIENLNKNLQMDGIIAKTSLGATEEANKPRIGIEFDMDEVIYFMLGN